MGGLVIFRSHTVYGNEMATITLAYEHQRFSSSSIFSAKSRQTTNPKLFARTTRYLYTRTGFFTSQKPPKPGDVPQC